MDVLQRHAVQDAPAALKAVARVRPVAMAAAAAIAVTAFSGAFVAGLDAGHAYNDWPWMAERFIPEQIWEAPVRCCWCGCVCARLNCTLMRARVSAARLPKLLREHRHSAVRPPHACVHHTGDGGNAHGHCSARWAVEGAAAARAESYYSHHALCRRAGAAGHFHAHDVRARAPGSHPPGRRACVVDVRAVDAARCTANWTPRRQRRGEEGDADVGGGWKTGCGNNSMACVCSRNTD